VISIDANVLIYAVDVDMADRHIRAKEIIAAANHANTVLTEQAIFEFFHVATRKGKMSPSDAELVVRKFTRDLPLVLPHPAIVEDALTLRLRYRIGIWDARLLAVCAAHGCTHLLSEDLQDGARYNGVAIVNPFRAANAATIGSLLT